MSDCKIQLVIPAAQTNCERDSVFWVAWLHRRAKKKDGSKPFEFVNNDSSPKSFGIARTDPRTRRIDLMLGP